MSVITQSHELSPLAARNSSPDANPRARYPSEQSDSTSAVLNGSSSSMTAIRGSLDTHHPGLWLRPAAAARAVVASDGAPENYTRVLYVMPDVQGALGLTTSAMRTRSARVRAPILRMAAPRWILTVISLIPRSPATCLFIFPVVTIIITCCSRADSVP